MRLDAGKLDLSTAAVFAVAWITCSVLVTLVQGPMIRMSGHIMHADLDELGWTMPWEGFFVGLILWSVLAGRLVWAVAAFYNRLIDGDAA